MKNCPVCQQNTASAMCCDVCGFDRSCHYEAYPSLRPVPAGTRSLAGRRLDYKRAQQSAAYANSAARQASEEYHFSKESSPSPEWQWKAAPQPQPAPRPQNTSAQAGQTARQSTSTGAGAGAARAPYGYQKAGAAPQYARQGARTTPPAQKMPRARKKSRPAVFVALAVLALALFLVFSPDRDRQADKTKPTPEATAPAVVQNELTAPVEAENEPTAPDMVQRAWNWPNVDLPLSEADEAMMARWEAVYERIFSSLAVQADVDYSSDSSIHDMVSRSPYPYIEWNEKLANFKFYVLYNAEDLARPDPTYKADFYWEHSDAEETTVSFQAFRSADSDVLAEMNRISILPQGVRFGEDMLSALGIPQDMLDWAGSDRNISGWSNGEDVYSLSWRFSSPFYYLTMNHYVHGEGSKETFIMDFTVYSDGQPWEIYYRFPNRYFESFASHS